MFKSNPLPLGQQIHMTGWNTTKAGRKIIYIDSNKQKHQTKPLKDAAGFMYIKYNNGIYYIKENPDRKPFHHMTFRLCGNKVVNNDGVSYNINELEAANFKKYAPILDVDIEYLQQLLENNPIYVVEQILGMPLDF